MWFIKIGTSIKGPFDEHQLKMMLARREFSRFHLVSVDKQNWESAASLVAMLENTSVQKTVTKKVEEWYYAEDGGKKGPYSIGELKKFVKDGTISGQTQIFDPKAKSWCEARSVGQLNSSHNFLSRRVLLGIGSLAVLVALGTLGWTLSSFLFNGSVPSEENLRKCVGRVQFIKEHQLENGSVVEFPAGHGTGFCVTESGYFLTNRHVLSDYKKGVQDSKLGSKAQMKTKAAIFLGEDRFEADVVYISKKFDLAVLKLDRKKKMPFLRLSSVREPLLTAQVYAVGYPGVATMDSEYKDSVVRAGAIEATKAIKDKKSVYVNSFITESDLEISMVGGRVTKKSKSRLGRLVFHSAAIFGGNSGGPLLDKNGCVLAINTQIKMDLEDVQVKQNDGKVIKSKISSGKLNVAYLMHQFRTELEEHIDSDELHWK